MLGPCFLNNPLLVPDSYLKANLNMAFNQNEIFELEINFAFRKSFFFFTGSL
jgi:hypothetical protein